MVPLVVDLVREQLIFYFFFCFSKVAGGKMAGFRGAGYLHPRQHRTTVDLVVSDSGEAGEVGGQHLRHWLEDKSRV